MAQLERTQTPDDHASPSPSVSHLKTQKIVSMSTVGPLKARKGRQSGGNRSYQQAGSCLFRHGSVSSLFLFRVCSDYRYDSGIHPLYFSF